MDFKKLLENLERIENEALLERAHIKDVDATADITDKSQRYAALAKLAKSGGYAGMFDPVTGNFIDTNGSAAWIGAFKSEVQQLANHGLIPNAAKEKTSHLLGNMGMDEKEAGDIQTNVRKREQAIEKASGFINKALETFKTAAPKTVEAPKAVQAGASNESLNAGLARALTESFGYNYKQLIESISREDHKYIKDVMTQVKDVQNDDDVVEFKGLYKQYIQRRDLLVEQITKLVAKIKAKTTVKPIKESKGNTAGLTKRTYLHWEGGNTLLEFHLYYDKAGDLVEYKWSNRENKPFDVAVLLEGGKAEKGGFWQGVSDLGAGAASGLTFGYNDHIVAGLKSLYHGTKFADELHNEFKHTEEIKKRSPYLYVGGQLLGGVALGTLVPGAGWVKAGGQLALTGAEFAGNWHSNRSKEDNEIEWLKNHPDGKQNPTKNKPNVNNQQQQNNQQQNSQQQQNNPIPQAGAGMSGPSDPVVKSLQQKLIAAGFGVGVHKDDGRFGPDTIAAVKAYTKKNGGSDADSITKLLAITPKVAESITYSSMSESERMSYLRNRLDTIESTQLNEFAEVIPFIARVLRIGAAEAEALAPFVKGGLRALEAGTAELEINGLRFSKLSKDGNRWLAVDTRTGGQVVKTTEELAAEAKLAAGGKPPTPPVKTKTTPEPEPLPDPSKANKPGFDAQGRPIRVTNNTQQVVGNGNQVAQNGSSISNTTHNTYNTYNIAGKEVTQAEFTAVARTQGATGAIAEQAVVAELAAITPKAPGILSRIWNSRVLRKWSYSKAFLVAAVSLAAFHYMFDDAGNITTDVDTPVTPPVTPTPPVNRPVNPPVNPPVIPDVDNKPVVDPDVEELRDLIRQYNEAFPDDPLDPSLQADVDKILGSSGAGNKPAEDGMKTVKAPPGTPTSMLGQRVDTTKLANDIASGKIDPYAGGDVNNTSITNVTR